MQQTSQQVNSVSADFFQEFLCEYVLEIGDMCKRLRESRGWSMQEVANRAGISKSGYAKVEWGEHTLGPPVGLLVRICKAFGTNVAEILPSNV